MYDFYNLVFYNLSLVHYIHMYICAFDSVSFYDMSALLVVYSMSFYKLTFYNLLFDIENAAPNEFFLPVKRCLSALTMFIHMYIGMLYV
jgi:hypothetical protein